MKTSQTRPQRICTPEQRRHIISLWTIQTKTRDISFQVKVPQVTVNEVLNAYLRQLKRMEKQTSVRNDIIATSYDNHDELNRHYAGCEYEDNRPPHLRGLDWPIKGYL
jgi:hypothetical protein